MRKPKLRVVEKYIDGDQLTEILIALLLPNTLVGNESHEFLIEPQQKGEKHESSVLYKL